MEEGNRQMKTPHHVHSVALACAISLMASGVVHAQIIGAVSVGNTIPVTNALGQNLHGSWLFPDDASRVEIREVGPAIIPPDPATGEGNNTQNPFVTNSYMGYNSLGTDPGIFAIIISNRLERTTNYFARVYDRNTPGDSIYYANSVPFVVSDGQANVTVVFQTLYLVSGEADVDTDGDGIPNAMEDGNVYLTSSTNSDSDADGYPDGFEAVHEDYLRPMVPDPNDIWVETEDVSGNRMAVWWSIPEVGYRLEYTDAMTDPEAFTEIWNGPAVGTNLEVVVEEYWMTNSLKGFFRWAIP